MSDLRNLKAGDSVAYRNVGWGLTSYERGDKDVQEIKDGKLYTDTFSSFGMEWDEASQSWKFDGGLGMVTYAVAADDPRALQYYAESGEDEA